MLNYLLAILGQRIGVLVTSSGVWGAYLLFNLSLLFSNMQCP